MTLSSSVRISLWSTLFAVCSLIAAGCASTPVSTREATSSTKAASSIYLIDDRGIVRAIESNPVPESIHPAVTFAGFYSMRPGSKEVAISVKNGATTQLGLLSADGSFRTIHEYPGETAYTLAWSPDGDLAFGYASPQGNGIGVYEANGTTRDVGCSASSRAVGWADEKRIVVAGTDNRYVVAASDCETISRVDSRKMHEGAFNPKKPLVAFILRELEYDRGARQYVPDSSLHMSDPDGKNQTLIAGDKYRPHRPSWSPDGTELAFDARTPERPNQRLISVYDIEQGSSAFLNPSSLEAPVSEWDARWSPSGSVIAHMQRYGDAPPVLVARPMNGSFTALVGESGERFARWIDDTHLVVTNGTVERLVSIDGVTSVSAPPGATILRVD